MTSRLVNTGLLLESTHDGAARVIRALLSAMASICAAKGLTINDWRHPCAAQVGVFARRGAATCVIEYSEMEPGQVRCVCVTPGVASCYTLDVST